MNRGFDELSNGNFQKAEEYLEKALSNNPENLYAILNGGVFTRIRDALKRPVKCIRR